MRARTGVTLIEVLVAIFVMGIGLLALLTLFPIGVLTMQRAIQDDRTAHAASTAFTIAKIRIQPSQFDQPPVRFFTNPNPAPQPGEAKLVDAPITGPSYPIYIDTVGDVTYLPPFKNWVGGQSNGVHRVPLPPGGQATALKWHISPDDIVFDDHGRPDLVSTAPPVFERNSTYSWAYLIRRPLQGKPSVVDLTVVVYDERPLSLSNNLQSGETQYNATFKPADNIVTVTWGAAQNPPNIEVGGWILDSTPVFLKFDPNNPSNNEYGPPHAKFYRVVGIVQTASNRADLEVQTPITGFPLPNPNPPPPVAGQHPGVIVVMEGIAEVFERGAIDWPLP